MISFWKKRKKEPERIVRRVGDPFYPELDPRILVMMILVFSLLGMFYLAFYLWDVGIPVLFDPILMPDFFPMQPIPEF